MSTEVKSSDEQVNTHEIPGGTVESKTTQDSLEQAKKIASQVLGQLGDAPDYLVDTFNEYKRPITVIGLVLGALVAVKMAFAILSAINDIPVLSPTFELIGLIYTGWFIWRYLFKADNRKELLGSLSATKDQVIGRNS
ncbi:MAG: CAAD domain-containing protein [Cyanobacteria bacterium J06642_9]